MKVVLESEFVSSDMFSKYTVISNVKFTNPAYMDLLMQATPEMEEAITAAVRDVGNTEILKVDTFAGYVFTKDQRFPIIHLGTAESVFLLTEIAVQAKLPVAFIYLPKELSDRTLSKYIRRYRDKDILFISDYDSNMLKIRVRLLTEGKI